MSSIEAAHCLKIVEFEYVYGGVFISGEVYDCLIVFALDCVKIKRNMFLLGFGVREIHRKLNLNNNFFEPFL